MLKRHCTTHWCEQCGMDSYRQRQISQSRSEISNNCGKMIDTLRYITALLTDVFNKNFADTLQSKLPKMSLITWPKRGLAMSSLSDKKLPSTILLHRFIVSLLRSSNDNLLSFARLNSGSVSMVFQTLCLNLTTSSPPSINTFIWNQSKEVCFLYLSNGPGGNCFSISSMPCLRCDSLSKENRDMLQRYGTT